MQAGSGERGWMGTAARTAVPAVGEMATGQAGPWPQVLAAARWCSGMAMGGGCPGALPITTPGGGKRWGHPPSRDQAPLGLVPTRDTPRFSGWVRGAEPRHPSPQPQPGWTSSAMGAPLCPQHPAAQQRALRQHPHPQAKKHTDSVQEHTFRARTHG